MESFYPRRKNIWEYLNDDAAEYSNIADQNTNKKMNKQTLIKHSNCGIVKTLIFFLLSLAVMISLLTPDKIPQAELIRRILPKTKFISFHGTSVGEECCHRMRHLAVALKRTERALRHAGRLRRAIVQSQIKNKEMEYNETIDKGYIEGARAFKGSNTTEWGTLVSLWGVIPLWHLTPSPNVVLSARRPTPSDCWPIRGSQGEIIIELPKIQRVNLISIEHIRPDITHSAPKNFNVYGIFSNGTWIKTAVGVYKKNKPAKQYYHLDTRNSEFEQIVFKVLSNQGNPNYTCIYRIHIYTIT